MVVVPHHLLVATSNPGKLREVLAVLHLPGLVCRTLRDLPPIKEVEETGTTFAANAELKASYYSVRSGLLTLADDSGLEVDALKGAPGVRSARYAGEPSDDLANNAKLIHELQGVPLAERTARFRCALALADGHRIIARSEGVIHGLIINEPRGQNGFGYDPHFWVPELKRTTAELPPEQKNRISHRGQALRAIAGTIAAIMGQRATC